MSEQKGPKLPKHHYIPVFYLKQWANANGRLIEYSKPYRQVEARPTSPKGTGYVRGLYRLPNVAEEKAELVETAYMKVVDDAAAKALQVILGNTTDISHLSQLMMRDWARFLHCLMLRNPEYVSAMSRLLSENVGDYVDEIKDRYLTERAPSDPETFEEYKKQFLTNPLNTFAPRIINRIVDNPNIIRHMCSMRWHVITFSHSRNLLLTSDRLIIMTNGLGNPGAHLALPISPTQLFVACNDQHAYMSIRRQPGRDLIRTSNTKVLEQARKYAYGFSDADISFVRRHFGKQIPANPLETGILRLVVS